MGGRKTQMISVAVVACLAILISAIIIVKNQKDVQASNSDSKYCQITSEQVEQLTADMSREEVLNALGETEDIGSGRYIYVYEVDQKYLLKIGFDGDDANLNLDGDALLGQLEEL